MQTYPTGYAESHHIAEQIFREILPRHGMAVREEQIALCHEVLDTLYNKDSLSKNPIIKQRNSRPRLQKSKNISQKLASKGVSTPSLQAFSDSWQQI